MVANKTNMKPILFNVNSTYNLSLYHNSRQFTMSLAVANIKYKNLGTTFFGTHIITLDTQTMSLTFKPNHFTILLTLPPLFNTKKTYNFFSYVIAITSKQSLHFPPQSKKNIHFPLQTLNSFLSKLNLKIIYFQRSHTHILSKRI